MSAVKAASPSQVPGILRWVRAMLPEHATGKAFGNPELLPDALNTGSTTGGAYQFPEAGHEPRSAQMWEVAPPSSGEIITLMRDDAHAADIAKRRSVFTLPGNARLIQKLGSAVLDAKRVYRFVRVDEDTTLRPECDFGNLRVALDALARVFQC